MTSLVFLSSFLTVCNEIDQWPSPVPGLTLNLPVMGVVLQVRGMALPIKAGVVLFVRKGRGHTGDGWGHTGEGRGVIGEEGSYR